jgi:hypothetical protein
MFGDFVMILTSRQLYSAGGKYKSRTVWQTLGFDVKPEYYGKPAARVKRKDSLFNVYTQEQVYSTTAATKETGL